MYLHSQWSDFEIRIICGVIPGRGLLPASPESILRGRWLWIVDGAAQMIGFIEPVC